MIKKLSKSAIALAIVTAVSGAHAAVGDTLVYSFNAPSVGRGVVGPISQATLTLVETAIGVDFTLSPNWAQTTGRFVDLLKFAYSGEAVTYVDGAGPNATFSTGTGAIDNGYSAAAFASLDWPANPKFDNTISSASWSLNGSTITLADFGILVSATSTKPAPAYGVISMPGAGPSNWVAGEGVLTPVPEASSISMALVAFAMLGGLAAKRRRG